MKFEEGAVGLVPGKQLNSGASVSVLADWASAVQEEPGSDQSFCLNVRAGLLKEKKSA